MRSPHRQETQATLFRLGEVFATEPAMVQGGKKLASSSELANPDDARVPDVFAAFEKRDTSLLLLIQSSRELEEVVLEEVHKASIERIDWGKNNGQLGPKSRIEQNRFVAGYPSLLTELFLSDGGRMRTYDIFVQEYPNNRNTITIIQDSGVFEEGWINEFLDSLKI